MIHPTCSMRRHRDRARDIILRQIASEMAKRIPIPDNTEIFLDGLDLSLIDIDLNRKCPKLS